MRGRKRKNGPIQEFLDKEWFDSDLGRSPKAIAERLNVSVDAVTAILRHRRDGLVKKVDKIPIALEKHSWYSVDPYRMRVEFHCQNNNFFMTEEEMILAIRENQNVASIA